jgi:hypothetical protein
LPPNQWTATQIRQAPAAAGYPNTFNSCAISGSPVNPSPLTVNPSDAPITCVADTTLTTGKVGFLVVGFKALDRDADGVADPYNFAADYVRGCVDECKETMSSCPACLAAQTMEFCPGYVPNLGGTGPDPTLNRSNCGEDNGGMGYGKLVCGCGGNLGGPNCDVGCPDSQLHSNRVLSANLDSPDGGAGAGTGRTGYWMCGEFTGSSYAPGETSVAGGGYSLRGKVPMAPKNAAPLTGGGYTLR